MSNFNVGDRVYLEGEISKYDESDNTYCIDYYDYYKRSQTSCWVKDDVLHPADDAYNKGLEDAWELAKKIVLFGGDGGYSSQELKRIFDFGSYEAVLKAFTPQEALAKVKAYEEKHDEIKVGDVVTIKDGVSDFESIVTKVSGRVVYRLFSDGSCDGYADKEDLEKTGKHFDSIDEFMRSTDD